MRADDAPATGAKLSLGLHHGRAGVGILVRRSNKSSQFVRRLHEHCPTVMLAGSPVIPAQAGIKSVRIGLAARGEFRKPWIPASAGMTSDQSFCACMKRSNVASVKRNQRFWSER